MANRPVYSVEDDPGRPYKAYVSTFITLFATFLAYWVADVDPFTNKEMGEAFLIALGASGVTGGATFAIRNPKR